MEKMLEEVKYCKTVIKKYFNKPLAMTEVDDNTLTLSGLGGSEARMAKLTAANQKPLIQ